MHDVPLLSTLAMGLSSAFVGGMIATRLRLSPIVGYLLAGVLIGPFTPGFVADGHTAAELSEIGVVLLMFGVGLHLSMKDLLAVKKIAIPGAVVQILTATGLGVLAAQFWGWSVAASLIFGLALSVASTVVLLRALEASNSLHTINGHIAVGWLIVEDLAMVLALVLIPALAPGLSGAGDGQNTDWVMPLLVAIGKVTLFVIFMLVVGKRALPWMLHLVVQSRSRELFTLAVFAVAVGVAFGAAQLFGVSFALGAFFAGMMIKESVFSDEVADKVLPFQDAFAVLFFVSVGMLFDPFVLIQKPLHVLTVVLIIMVGKSIAAFLIVRLFRYPGGIALMVSASLAQIGEFSFILGGLGLQYGLLSNEGNSLILAGAIISILLNPVTFLGVRALYSRAANSKKLASWLDLSGDELSHLDDNETQPMKDLVILVGYGRVGAHIVQELGANLSNLVVIDLNRERIEQLREQGVHALAADATHPEVLEEAAIAKAKAIIVAVPSAFEARRIVKLARKLHPGIRVLVRAHNNEEFGYFNSQKVDLAVMGERETARRMIEYLRAK